MFDPVILVEMDTFESLSLGSEDLFKKKESLIRVTVKDIFLAS